LTWQDGEPWTAHDVEWSWRAITDDRMPASAFKTYASELEDVSALDDRAVRFVHREALATRRLNMAFPIIPATSSASRSGPPRIRRCAPARTTTGTHATR
jgi:ABC-type transport system substrate-binding protein